MAARAASQAANLRCRKLSSLSRPLGGSANLAICCYEMVLFEHQEGSNKNTHLSIYIYTHSCELSSFFFQVISMDDNHPMMLMHPYTNSPQKVRWVVAASSKEWAWATTSTTPKCPKMTRRPRKTLGILRRSLDRWTTSLKDINL